MTDSNTGEEATILEERRRKLEELRAENKAYINDFIPSEHALDLHELHMGRRGTAGGCRGAGGGASGVAGGSTVPAAP